MRKIAFSALAAFSLAALSTPAAAEKVSASVPYGDLDLSSPAGMTKLQGRVDSAAKRLCGTADIRDLHDVADQQRCVREIHASAAFEMARLSGKPGKSAVLALNGTRR
jgi:UrcA family protein